MQKRIKYNHTFLVFHRHIEMAFRTHKSFLLQPIGHSQVSASEVQLVEMSLLGYHTEKYHIVSLLSKSIDHTMDTTSTRSCYNPSEKTMNFAEDYQGLSRIIKDYRRLSIVKRHVIHQRQRHHHQQVPVNVLDAFDFLLLHP